MCGYGYMTREYDATVTLAGGVLLVQRVSGTRIIHVGSHKFPRFVYSTTKFGRPFQSLIVLTF